MYNAELKLFIFYYLHYTRIGHILSIYGINCIKVDLTTSKHTAALQVVQDTNSPSFIRMTRDA